MSADQLLSYEIRGTALQLGQDESLQRLIDGRRQWPATGQTRGPASSLASGSPRRTARRCLELIAASLLLLAGNLVRGQRLPI